MDTAHRTVDLHRVSNAEGCQNPKDAVQLCQRYKPLPHSPGHDIHGAACVTAVGLYPVMDCQRSFGVFGSHANKTADPHPEYRSGTTQTNGARHTCQIPGSNRCSQCRTQGLKGGHTVGFLTSQFFPKSPQRPWQQPQLDTIQADRQTQSNPKDEDQCRRAPDNRIDGFKQFGHTPSKSTINYIRKQYIFFNSS